MNTTNPTISSTLARFVEQIQPEDIPPEVYQRAKYLILDAVGIAWASTHYDFAHRTLSALSDLSQGAGHTPVIGLPHKLQARDAMLMNGLLVHGLDFDDTHAAGVIHATASCFPAALGVSGLARRSGKEMLAAYILGVEVTTRLGAVAKGGFHQVGFHPTGLVGAFGCALIASRLMGLTAHHMSMAQGIALSMAAGSLEFLQDGAWTKRAHPGLAAVAGYTAATMARHGFVGPQQTYEGRFGLFQSHLGALMSQADLNLATRGLGQDWELPKVSVKPIPACHFTHASADAAALLREQFNLDWRDIESVEALVPAEVVKTVCEPVHTKQQPQNSYDAQFSIPYTVATSLIKGEFKLGHLDDAALSDPAVLQLAQKVSYRVDPNSPFPTYYSGEVVVTMKDGRTLRHREEVNRGASDRPLSGADIEKKFMGNVGLVAQPARAQELLELVMALDGAHDANQLAAALARY